MTDVLGAVEEASGLTLGSPKVKIEDIKVHASASNHTTPHPALALALALVLALTHHPSPLTIKMAGTYDFTIKLHSGITAVLSLNVVPEETAEE